MPITEDEARECRLQLENILNKHKMDWVVSQAHEKIELGKTVSKQVQAGEVVTDRLTGVLRRTPGRAAEFLSSVPFSETEQLNIILEAVELSIESTAKMHVEIFERLGPQVNTIEFRPVEDPTPFQTLERSSVSSITTRGELVGTIVRNIRGAF